jgi:UDPglucose 6-dehydrogenase
MKIKVGLIGVGFVGSALLKSFREKGINIVAYDKYKQDEDLGTFDDCLDTDIIFLCLPTLFDYDANMYDMKALTDICHELNERKYPNLVVIKSTVTPHTTEAFSQNYSNLQFCHNPEFLKAKTAYEDFHNQKHIILGKSSSCTTEKFDSLLYCYKEYYPDAKFSVCTSSESESMKIFVNSFYSSKIQLFNEYYLLCKKIDIDFQKVRELMLKNNRINPNDTNVPGPDGQLGYGGACFPKDTNALLATMKRIKTEYKVLEAVIEERNKVRPDDLDTKLYNNAKYNIEETHNAMNFEEE